MRANLIRTLAALATAAAVINLAAAFGAPGCARVAWAIAGQPVDRVQELLIGLLVLVLARGLAGRRRLALPAGLAGLGLCAMDALSDRAWYAVGFAGIGAALAAVQPALGVRADPRRLRLAAQVAAATGVLVLAGSGWYLAVDHQPPGAVGHAVLAGVAAGSAPHTPLASLLALLAAVGTLAFLVLALAPAMAPEPGTPAQRAQVGALVGHPDADSLAPFATRADKAYAFSPDHRAAIGYRVILGTALAGGDPVGERSASGAAMAAFTALCASNGWRPAVLGASDSYRERWPGYGLRRAVAIGDEAVLSPGTFSMRSRRMRNVRQSVARTRNAGVCVRVAALTPELARRLAPVRADWLDGRAERGFAMNLDALLTPRPDTLIVIAEDSGGEPVAFARFATCAAGAILTLDVAPRRRDAPNGVVERLVAETVEYAAARDVREVSLNFAGLRGVLDAPGPVPLAGRAFDRWIKLGPLYRFCAKFEPTWRRRSVLLRSWWDLVPVGVAALWAEFGRSSAAAGAFMPSGAAAQPEALIVADQGLKRG